MEKGTIDTRLQICALATEFQVDTLEAVISGDVKTTTHQSICCTDNFIVTKISR
ncbi:MAG: hypothetical protein ABI416_09065 [Ginsengibacter sp.]